MKRIFLSLLLLVISVFSFAQSSHSQTEIFDKLQRYLQQYPQAQLRDIYKTCFQDVYGPGHLLSDTVVAYDFIRREIANTKVFGGPLYEPTGYSGNFYRVNILLVANGTITIDKFMQAFVRSANDFEAKISVNEWHQQWKQVETILKGLMSWTNDCREDSKQIEKMLLQNQYMCHHSKRFNETYNFHYRIIRKDIFENELLPLINK